METVTQPQFAERGSTQILEIDRPITANSTRCGCSRLLPPLFISCVFSPSSISWTVCRYPLRKCLTVIGVVVRLSWVRPPCRCDRSPWSSITSILSREPPAKIAFLPFLTDWLAFTTTRCLWRSPCTRGKQKEFHFVLSISLPP